MEHAVLDSMDRDLDRGECGSEPKELLSCAVYGGVAAADVVDDDDADVGWGWGWG